MICLHVVNGVILSMLFSATRLVVAKVWPSSVKVTSPILSPFFSGACILSFIVIFCVIWFSFPFSINVPALSSRIALTVFLIPLLTLTFWITSF